MADPMEQRNWQSVRTVLEGLILIMLVWLGSTTQQQMRETIQLQTQMVDMSTQLHSLQTQLGDVPALARAIAGDEVRIEEHERRISTLESLHRGYK